MAERDRNRTQPNRRKPTQRSSARSETRGMRAVRSDSTPSRRPSSNLTQRLGRAAEQTREQRSAERRGPTSRLRAVESKGPARRGRSAAGSAERSSQRRSSAPRSRGREAVAEKKPVKRSRIVVFALILAVLTVCVIAAFSTFCQIDNNKIRACEQWRTTVQKACLDTKLDDHWTDAILALMAVESGGKVDVDSVEGVESDVMQAAEGAYGNIVKEGSEAFGVQAQTPEASIYAGVLEFKQNLELWKQYLSGIGVGEVEEIQLVVQGYNFGADGWYAWCKEQGITEYSLEKAQEYSETKMPENAKGTPTHAEKWLNFYEKLRG